ncbi:MAG: metallophosphoesterase, partial [Planctomycetota bacterium]
MLFHIDFNNRVHDHSSSAIPQTTERARAVDRTDRASYRTQTVKIFALSDPHLALGTPGKTMDVFGDHWREHHRTIEREWKQIVTDDDLVLVPGDISWAMKVPGAQPDLNFLGRLPGRKVLLKGNHDYWWASANKVRKAVPDGMYVVHGDAIAIDDAVLI